MAIRQVGDRSELLGATQKAPMTAAMRSSPLAAFGETLERHVEDGGDLEVLRSALADMPRDLTPEARVRQAQMALDWLVREYAVRWVTAFAHEGAMAAAGLRDLAPIVDDATALRATEACRAAVRWYHPGMADDVGSVDSATSYPGVRSEIRRAVQRANDFAPRRELHELYRQLDGVCVAAYVASGCGSTPLLRANPFALEVAIDLVDAVRDMALWAITEQLARNAGRAMTLAGMAAEAVAPVASLRDTEGALVDGHGEMVRAREAAALAAAESRFSGDDLALGDIRNTNLVAILRFVTAMRS